MASRTRTPVQTSPLSRATASTPRTTIRLLPQDSRRASLSTGSTLPRSTASRASPASRRRAPTERLHSRATDSPTVSHTSSTASPGYGQQFGGFQPGAPAGPVQRPQTIDRSYWLILAAGAIFGIINLISAFLPNLGMSQQQMDLLEQQLSDAGMPISVQELLPLVQTTTIVMTLILVGVYVLIARGIRNGSNVARIFGTIFAAISVFSIFGLGFLYVVPGIVGIVFAYLRPSSEYMRARAWEKASGIRR